MFYFDSLSIVHLSHKLLKLQMGGTGKETCHRTLKTCPATVLSFTFCFSFELLQPWPAGGMQIVTKIIIRVNAWWDVSHSGCSGVRVSRGFFVLLFLLLLLLVSSKGRRPKVQNENS